MKVLEYVSTLVQNGTSIQNAWEQILRTKQWTRRHQRRVQSMIEAKFQTQLVVIGCGEKEEEEPLDVLFHTRNSQTKTFRLSQCLPMHIRTEASSIRKIILLTLTDHASLILKSVSLNEKLFCEHEQKKKILCLFISEKFALFLTD